ncbi:MAG: YlmC/YmxH family sporulation protein [bacterium]|nr:YlmC/YmxH family sporulation protein [bacterium]
MFRAMKLRQLEVISVNDARRLGFVRDVDINESDGSVTALIVPKGTGLLGRLFHRGEYVIPWDCIVAAGRDLVLVRIEDGFTPKISV